MHHRDRLPSWLAKTHILMLLVSLTGHVLARYPALECESREWLPPIIHPDMLWITLMAHLVSFTTEVWHAWGVTWQALPILLQHALVTIFQTRHVTLGWAVTWDDGHFLLERTPWSNALVICTHVAWLLLWVPVFMVQRTVLPQNKKTL